MNKLTTMFAAGVIAVSATSANATSVSLELMLLTDVSGSVNSTDYNLMLNGYAQAFQSATVQDKILNSATGSIAVAVAQFDTGYNGLGVGWTLIDSVAAANNFASSILAMTRAGSGSTGMAAGLAGAAGEFATNGFDGLRQVIDLAGDGAESVQCSYTATICPAVQNARDAALAAGIDTINALFINDRDFFGDGPGFGVDSIAYGTNNVIGGAGSFVVSVGSFGDFAPAIEAKIIKEITPPIIPVPASLPLLGSALAAFGFLRRKRKAS